MKRPQLEHVIRAAAGITGAPEIVVIGSQAVLGQFPDAPAELLVAGREKDTKFVTGLLRNRLADVALIESRLCQTALAVERLEAALARLKRLAQA